MKERCSGRPEARCGQFEQCEPGGGRRYYDGEKGLRHPLPLLVEWSPHTPGTPVPAPPIWRTSSPPSSPSLARTRFGGPTCTRRWGDDTRRLHLDDHRRSRNRNEERERWDKNWGVRRVVLFYSPVERHLETFQGHPDPARGKNGFNPAMARGTYSAAHTATRTLWN